MELFYELLLTAVVSILFAFLLGKLFAPDASRPEIARRPGPAGNRADQEDQEEEKIIEVDAGEVKQNVGASGDAARADVAMARGVAPPEKAQSWIEEEKVSPTVVVEKLERTIQEEQASAKTQALRAAEVHYWAAGADVKAFLVRGSEEQIMRVAREKQQHPGDVLDMELESEKLRIAGDKQQDLAAEAALKEVSDVEMAVIGAKQHDFAAEAALKEVIDVELEEEEEEKKELQEQPVGEAPNVFEEVEGKEEGKCKACIVDPGEQLVTNEEKLVVKKVDEVGLSHKGVSVDRTVAGLRETVATLEEVRKEEFGVDGEFGEWEGIERSEVERCFGAAVAFAGSDVGTAALLKLSSDVQLRLQGLLRVAIDGPCYDSSQPLALRPSSRAKWVAWQKLGNMNPEVAMEEYMALLSENIPGWMGENASEIKQRAASDSKGSISISTHTSGPQSSEENKDGTGLEESHIAIGTNPDKGIRSDRSAE